MNIIFYHGSDFDGMCSGQITARHLSNPNTWGFNHKDPFPSWFKPTKEDTVWFVDITTNPPERIKELLPITNVMVIDHHESFIKWAKANIPSEILSTWVLDSSKAACQLCWEYFEKDAPMPKAVEYFARYDIWDRKDITLWNERLTPFQQGLKGTRFDSPIWELFFADGADDVIESYIKKGLPIVEYQITSNDSIMKKHAFSAILKYKGKKLRALVCNTHNFSSITFESIWNEEEYDLMIAFNLSKRSYWVSFYTTTDLDCSEIAFNYGGGGHKQACGFEAKKVKIVEWFGKKYIKFKT